MADVFIDCEWMPGEYLTIVGAYSYGEGRCQLHGRRLTRRLFVEFVQACRRSYRETFLMCHGPDIGRIENHLKLNLRRSFCCINTLTAFRKLAGFKTVSLDHLERHFHLPRQYSLSWEQIFYYWKSGRDEWRRIVLDYNWEDCVNLWRLVRILMREYGVTRDGLKSIAM